MLTESPSDPVLRGRQRRATKKKSECETPSMPCECVYGSASLDNRWRCIILECITWYCIMSCYIMLCYTLCMYICICRYVYIYIYIYRERERLYVREDGGVVSPGRQLLVLAVAWEHDLLLFCWACVCVCACLYIYIYVFICCSVGAWISNSVETANRRSRHGRPEYSSKLTNMSTDTATHARRHRHMHSCEIELMCEEA